MTHAAMQDPSYLALAFEVLVMTFGRLELLNVPVKFPLTLFGDSATSAQTFYSGKVFHVIFTDFVGQQQYQ